jgi:hypothetical protein
MSETVETIVVLGFITFVGLPILLWVLSDILAQKRHEREIELERTHNPRPNLWAHLTLTANFPSRKGRK